MKKKYLSAVMLLLSTFVFSLYGQDIVSLKNGETIKVNVQEVNDAEVIFTYPKETMVNKLGVDQIKQIKFKSGRVQKFNNTTETNALEAAYRASQKSNNKSSESTHSSPYKINTPEPEYVGTILQIDEKGNVLNTLETKKSAVRSNANAGVFIVGVGKVKARNYVKERTSPVRISKGKILLLAKVTNSKINPKEIFNIFKLEQGKKDRSIVVGEAHTFAGSKVSEIDFLPFNAYPYKDSSFIVELNIEEPGEYAVTLDSSRETFQLFGID